MTTRALISLVLAGLLLAGCGPRANRVKGRLVNGAQPITFAPGAQAAVVLRFVGADGKPDPHHFYTAMIDPAGAFEVVASGGSVLPGTYQLSLDVAVDGKADKRFKPFAGTSSPLRQEVRPGNNDLTVDLAQPAPAPRP